MAPSRKFETVLTYAKIAKTVEIAPTTMAPTLRQPYERETALPVLVAEELPAVFSISDGI